MIEVGDLVRVKSHASKSSARHWARGRVLRVFPDSYAVQMFPRHRTPLIVPHDLVKPWTSAQEMDKKIRKTRKKENL